MICRRRFREIQKLRARTHTHKDNARSELHPPVFYLWVPAFLSPHISTAFLSDAAAAEKLYSWRRDAFCRMLHTKVDITIPNHSSVTLRSSKERRDGHRRLPFIPFTRVRVQGAVISASVQTPSRSVALCLSCRLHGRTHTPRSSLQCQPK